MFVYRVLLLFDLLVWFLVAVVNCLLLVGSVDFGLFSFSIGVNFTCGFVGVLFVVFACLLSVCFCFVAVVFVICFEFGRLCGVYLFIYDCLWLVGVWLIAVSLYLFYIALKFVCVLFCCLVVVWMIVLFWLMFGLV